MDDTASHHQGQLFTLVNGDLALLFPPLDRGIALTATLGNLFAADAPDPGLILSRWSMPDHFEELSAFLDAIPTLAGAPNGGERDSGLAAVTALFNGVQARRIRELLERQTGVLVTVSGPERVVPLYREIRFSLQALEVRAAASGHVTADPFLFRHLIAKLDIFMLAATTGDLDHDRPMLAGVREGGMFLHVNMSLEAVMSPAFTQLEEAAARSSARIAVEIAMLETFADTDLFVRARARVQQAGFKLILDDVSHHALLVTRPASLGFDWLKLDWSRQLLQTNETIDRVIRDIDPAKVILQKADTEDAVRWGLARGIRRFQGRHTDAILAAGRLAICPAASACSLRKCIERESAATQAGRVGCRNFPLLDTSVPAVDHVS
ncbi:MAG: EAL domain-containing protein [Pseudomonadota bacterium]|nr:EAL domain-containing protein [Pseudomonadota bacterium]